MPFFISNQILKLAKHLTSKFSGFPGYLCIQTTALAEESAVSRMVRLVEEAQTQRSNVEQLVEKFAKYYTPGNMTPHFMHMWLALCNHHIIFKYISNNIFATCSCRYPCHSYRHCTFVYACPQRTALAVCGSCSSCSGLPLRSGDIHTCYDYLCDCSSC